MREWNRSRERLEELRAVAGDGPWSIAELAEQGWTHSSVRAAVRSGRLVRVQRGLFALAGLDHGPDLRSQCAVALRRAREGTALSHPTAGRLHDLWIPRRWQDGLLHMTQPGGVDRRLPGVRVHGSRLEPTSITEIDGLPVTTSARTALDLARGGSLADALVVTDSAARTIIRRSGGNLLQLRSQHQRAGLRLLAESELREAFREVWTWPGTVIARAAIDLMDPASESPAESRSRAWFITAKLPLPVVAFEVRGASGAVYYADFAWPAHRLLGEVDGFDKYGQTPQQMRSRLREERVRQDDLIDAGWRVVRWSSADHQAQVVRRIRRALAE